MGCHAKLSKGPITIIPGFSREDGAPLFQIETAFKPRLHLGGEHGMPVPGGEKISTLMDKDLSPEGQAALKVLVAEITALVQKRSDEAVEKFKKDTGLGQKE